MRDDEAPIDEPDAERLLNLRGEVMLALNRGLAAGCDASDLLAVLAQATGETLACAGHRDATPILPRIANLIRINHGRMLKALAKERGEQAAAQAKPTVYRSGARR